MKKPRKDGPSIYGERIDYVVHMLFELERIAEKEGYLFASYLMGLARTDIEEKQLQGSDKDMQKDV